MKKTFLSPKNTKLVQFLNLSILVLILLNVLAVIYGTVNSLYLAYKPWFDWFEIFSIAVFSIDYIVRLIYCVNSNTYSRTKGAAGNRRHTKPIPRSARPATAASARMPPTLVADIRAAVEKYGLSPEWTVESLAYYTQAVIQGAFILAKAQQSSLIAASCLEHLHRYLQLLFTCPDSPDRPQTQPAVQPA